MLPHHPGGGNEHGVSVTEPIRSVEAGVACVAGAIATSAAEIATATTGAGVRSLDREARLKEPKRPITRLSLASTRALR